MAKSIFSQKISVFSDYYDRLFVGYTYSVANLFSFLVWALIILMSFGVAFSSPNIWTKGEVYNEQPMMKYTGKLFGQFLFAKEENMKQETVQLEYATL